MYALNNTKLERFFYVFICAIFFVAALQLAQPVVLPVFMAVFLTFILTPVVKGLQRFGLPRVVSAVVAAILLFAVIGCFLGFFFYQLNGLFADVPVYKTRTIEKINALRESPFGAWLGNAAELISNFELDAPAGKAVDPIPVKVQSSPLALVQTVAGTTLNVLVNVSLVFLLLIFMLIQREDLRNRIIRLGGSRNLTKTTKVFDEASYRIGRFLGMQLIINSGVGVILGLGLFALGVPYALVWGVFGALSRYIPYLGAWLAAFFPLVVTLAVMPSWSTFLIVLGLIATIELVTANVIEPILFGRSIGVTGLALLIATVFWTWLWGPLGLFLATPLTAYLVVLGRHVPALSFLASLMGEESPAHPHLVFFQRLLAKDAEEATNLVADQLKAQPVENVYDDILLPALNNSLLEKDRGTMDERDERFVLASTRALLQDLVWDPATKMANEATDASVPQPAFVGVASCESANALLADMLQERFAADRERLLVVCSQDDDALARLAKESPDVAVFVAWSQVELAQARRFCQRARGRCRGCKVVVFSWGHEDDPAAIREKLTSAGADAVGLSFAETLALVQSRLQDVPATRAAAANARESLALAASGH